MDAILISNAKLTELKKHLQQLKASLVLENEEGTKMGGPMDSFKEAAAFQVNLGAKRLKVKELEEIIAAARVLPEHVPGDKVVTGKWFLVNNGISSIRYRMVHPVEADPAKNLLSPASLLGKTVLNRKAGFAFTMNGRQFKLLSVE